MGRKERLRQKEQHVPSLMAGGGAAHGAPQVLGMARSWGGEAGGSVRRGWAVLGSAGAAECLMAVGPV